MTLRSRKLPSGFWKGSTARRRKPARALAPKARKAVAKIAKSVLNRQVETQYVCDNPELTYSAIYGDTVPSGGVAQVYPCLPVVSQTDADTSYGRRGIKISPKKLRTDLRFVFGDEPLIQGGANSGRVDAAAWDITVHIWYGYVKRYKVSSDITANAQFIADNLLETNGGTMQRFSGRLSDELFEKNKEFASVKHKQFRMFKNAGLPNILDTTIPAQNFPVQDAHRVSLSFTPPKALLYADETSTYPENYAPFMVVGYCHNDGTQAANASNAGPTTNPVQVPAIQMLQVNKLWFKDA